MTTSEVLALSPVERFVYWVGERHRIYERRTAGEPKPWTDDPILQSNYFTNVYRELDKTTIWFREQVREPLRDDPRVIFATIAFRWFNHIPTGEVLHERGWLLDWNAADVLSELGARRDGGEQIFTGAFMINSPPGEPKLEAIIRRISDVWKRRDNLLMKTRNWTRLAEAHADLIRFDGLGGFMAYEIVCDLRYTSFLEHADDKMVWSNPGPAPFAVCIGYSGAKSRTRATRQRLRCRRIGRCRRANYSRCFKRDSLRCGRSRCGK
jgi:hypothetical protein